MIFDRYFRVYFETPLYEIPKTFDDFEIPMDSSGAIDQVNLPLPEHMLTEAEEEPTAVARSPTLTTINTSPEIKPLHNRLKENKPNSPHNPQPISKNPVRKPLIQPPPISSKLARTPSNGQLSKSYPSCPTISSSRSNPLSIRSNLSSHKNSSKTALPRTKTPVSAKQSTHGPYSHMNLHSLERFRPLH